MDTKLVVGLAGMPGAGKSVVVGVAREKNYTIVVMGEIVREEARRRGLNPNPQNLGKIMLELREKEGPAVISKRCIPNIRRTKGDKIMIDGIRSLKEVEEFKKDLSNFTLVAIHSSPETRFARLHKRGRSDDSNNLETFHQRDVRELSVGLGNAIAMAEHMIVNDTSLAAVKEKAIRILTGIEEKWMK